MTDILLGVSLKPDINRTHDHSNVEKGQIKS